MKKWHITITDNETSENIFEKDSDAIIGAVGVDGGTHALGFTNCKFVTLCSALKVARQVIDEILADKPEVEQYIKLAELLDGMDTNDEHEEE